MSFASLLIIEQWIWCRHVLHSSWYRFPSRKRVDIRSHSCRGRPKDLVPSAFWRQGNGLSAGVHFDLSSPVFPRNGLSRQHLGMAVRWGYWVDSCVWLRSRRHKSSDAGAAAMWLHCRQSLVDGQLHVCALQHPAGGGASTRSEWNASEWQLHRSRAMHVGGSEGLSREQH